MFVTVSLLVLHVNPRHRRGEIMTYGQPDKLVICFVTAFMSLFVVGFCRFLGTLLSVSNFLVINDFNNYCLHFITVSETVGGESGIRKVSMKSMEGESGIRKVSMKSMEGVSGKSVSTKSILINNGDEKSVRKRPLESAIP